MRAFCLLLLLMVWPPHDANAETRVLFVGNSVSYYHGLPYVFEEVASDLYDADVHVDTWVQPGGLLSQASAQGAVMAELAADRYDVVVLQEWGSLLMCSQASETNWSDRCRTSLDAHSSIIAAAAGTDAVTILLGTNQMRADATAVLDRGERRMQLRANIDAHVPYGRLLLEGQDRFPDIPWLDPDGGHPGSGAVVLMACRIADEAFDSERGSLSNLDFFEPPRILDPSPSYQSLIKGTGQFQTRDPSILTSEQLAEIFEICDE